MSDIDKVGGEPLRIPGDRPQVRLGEWYWLETSERDIRQHFADQVHDYNRIVVIIQGLLDRSMVFHPHPPLKLWKEVDAEFIRPVYDDEMALYGGPKPDFRAYQQQLNKSIGKGTMVTGQRRYWSVITSDPEKRTIHVDLPFKLRLSGDNGPAKVMAAERRRRQSVDFLWERERAWSRSWYRYNGKEGGTLPVRLQRVPLDWLLNVDAYTPGDFKQFFADPRTREEYMQWAGLLLTAEAFKSGKAKKGVLQGIL
jgi:hypothetical protein